MNSGRQGLGGASTSPSAYGAYSTRADLQIPSESILTPDEPSTPEEREIVAFAWLGLLIGSFCMLLGSFYYLCVS